MEARRLGTSWAWGIALLMAAPAIAVAQAGSLAPIVTDSFLALVPPREVADIQRDIASAEQTRTAAANAERNAMSLRAGAEVLITAKKQQINDVKDRKKVAKRNKNDAAGASLEAQEKASEREKDLLERRKSLREAEIELAKKQTDLAELERAALRLEYELALKRAERAAVPPGSAGAVRLEQVTLDLEQATLEAQKKHAERQREVAERAKQVIERQLQILDARRKLVGG
jgi:hypothetical protein